MSIHEATDTVRVDISPVFGIALEQVFVER